MITINYCPEHGDLLARPGDGADARSYRCREAHHIDEIHAGFRRSEVPEPSAEPKHDELCAEWCNHCQVCGEGIRYGSRCREHYQNRPEPQGEPSDAQDIIVQEVSRLAGLRLLRRYSGFSDHWWDELVGGIARVALRAAGGAR